MKISVSTTFIYIITSSDNLEVRFLQDIARCALLFSCNKNVAYEKQVIVSDISKNELIGYIKFFDNFEVIASADVYGYIKNVESENLFIISSCHGSLHGIDAKEVICPHQFTEAIKQNAYIINCVCLFGQCYAGIFNHLNLKCPNKNIVYIGATEMRAGLSTLQSWKINESNVWEWCANIFVYHLASWLNAPIDVDNDGRYTIIDMYKYVCYMTNRQTEGVEKEEAKKYLDEKIKAEIGKVIPAEKDTKQILDKLDEEAKNELDYIIPHQDCWILNAECAINMVIEN